MKKNKAKVSFLEKSDDLLQNVSPDKVQSIDEEEYDEQEDSEDANFIADDEEVAQELSKEQKRKKRKLRKERQQRKQQDSSDEQLDDEDLDLIRQNQLGQKRRKLKKNQAVEEAEEHQVVKVEDDKNRVDKRKGIFERKTEDTEMEGASKDIGQQLKDKFVTEDLDELFSTPNDLAIVEKDIPERLQIKL